MRDTAGMSRRTPSLLLLAAVLAPARIASAVAGFATDGDDVYDKDGLLNGVVTVTGASENTSTTTSTTPTTTSTTAPTGSTTTSTSSSSTSTVTTTTVPAACATEPQGPTFASIVCRLESLEARIGSEPDLGTFAPKTGRNLRHARSRTEDARGRCAEGNVKKTRTRLKQAFKRMVQFDHRLSGRAARKTIPEGLRQDLLGKGDSVREHLRDLRAAVACPADAG